jgi:hypothetical protein
MRIIALALLVAVLLVVGILDSAAEIVLSLRP